MCGLFISYQSRIQLLLPLETLESPLDCKETQPVHPKWNQPWIFIGRTDAKAEAPILWPPDANSQLTGKDPAWCWERLRAGGEGDDKRWDGLMALLTQWTWVWANSGRWWRTGKPGMLQSMGSHRVGHYWATELYWWVYHWINKYQALKGNLKHVKVVDT